VDEGTVIQDPQALSDTLMIEERAYMARWLALEVLMTDEAVCDDEDLFDKLSALQDKWMRETLATRGVIPGTMS
jgi:hypothetical protein